MASEVLRNDLINLLAERDNDNVAVNVNGLPVDIEAVTAQSGSIVLQLDPEGLQHALDWVVSNSRRAIKP